MQGFFVKKFLFRERKSFSSEPAADGGPPLTSRQIEVMKHPFCRSNERKDINMQHLPDQ